MSASNPDEQAAHEAVAPDRLMDGENPATGFPEDARHWTGVYAELLSLKRDLIGTARQRAEAMSSRAAEEVRTTDLVILEAEADRLQRRLRFWETRLRDLDPDGAAG